MFGVYIHVISRFCHVRLIPHQQWQRTMNISPNCRLQHISHQLSARRVAIPSRKRWKNRHSQHESPKSVWPARQIQTPIKISPAALENTPQTLLSCGASMGELLKFLEVTSRLRGSCLGNLDRQLCVQIAPEPENRVSFEFTTQMAAVFASFRKIY